MFFYTLKGYLYMQFLQSVSGRKYTQNDYRAKTLSVFALVTFCALMLTGCAGGAQNQQALKNQTPTQQQNVTAENVAGQDTIDAMPSAVETLRALAPNKGLNTRRLFAEPLRNTDARVDRLESTVQKMKDDFDAVTPAVVRLVAIEQDIQGLIGELETLVETDTGAVQTMPHNFDANKIAQESQRKKDITAAAVADKTPAVPLEKAQGSTGAQASKIMMKERADATRLSIPVGQKTNAQAKLSSDGKQLIVQLGDVTWTGKTQWSSEFSPLLASYTVAAPKTAPVLKINLHFAAKILKTEWDSGNNGASFVVELQSEAIHFP